MPSLQPHPASPDNGVSAIRVEVIPAGRRLELRYHLAGDIARLRIPESREPVRAGELWRHTCFEVFIHRSPANEYVEYNFSPSGEWAAYRFSGYREGMTPLVEGAAPVIARQVADAGLEVEVTLDLGWLQDSFDTLRLGLTAVIEDRAQVLSYWALRHVSEKPDFHRAETFVAALV